MKIQQTCSHEIHPALGMRDRFIFWHWWEREGSACPCLHKFCQCRRYNMRHFAHSGLAYQQSHWQLNIHFDLFLSFSYHCQSPIFMSISRTRTWEKKLTPKLLYEQTWPKNCKELIPPFRCGLFLRMTSFCSSKAVGAVIFFGLCSDPKVFPKQDAACDIAKRLRCQSSVTSSTTHVTKESCNPPVQLGGAAFPLWGDCS